LTLSNEYRIARETARVDPISLQNPEAEASQPPFETDWKLDPLAVKQIGPDQLSMSKAAYYYIMSFKQLKKQRNLYDLGQFFILHAFAILPKS